MKKIRRDCSEGRDGGNRGGNRIGFGGKKGALFLKGAAFPHVRLVGRVFLALWPFSSMPFLRPAGVPRGALGDRLYRRAVFLLDSFYLPGIPAAFWPWPLRLIRIHFLPDHEIARKMVTNCKSPALRGIAHLAGSHHALGVTAPTTSCLVPAWPG